MITWENYEEYMMMHADGELNTAEEQALMAFVAANPALKSELAAYGMTKITPDTTLVYEHKDALLKPVPAKKVIAFPAWQRYSIAAGVAAIIFISVFKMSDVATDKHDTIPAVAQVTEKPDAIQPRDGVATPATASSPTTNITTVTEPIKETIAPAHTAIAAVNDTKKEHAVHPVTAKHTEPVVVAAVHSNDPINKVIPAGMKELANNSVAAAAPATTAVPDLALAQQEDDEPQRSFFDKLPIEDIKKKGLQSAATALANEVNSIKEEITQGSFSVKVEKRKLILSF